MSHHGRKAFRAASLINVTRKHGLRNFETAHTLITITGWGFSKMSNLSHRASRFAENTTESGYDAAVTIAARTTRAAFGHRDSSLESVRMVGEKLAAACEGVVGAGLAWGSFIMASALRGGATPVDFSHALFDMAEAAAGPAWRTVGANARRLSRTSP